MGTSTMDCWAWVGAEGSDLPMKIAISQRGSQAPDVHHFLRHGAGSVRSRQGGREGKGINAADAGRHQTCTTSWGVWQAWCACVKEAEKKKKNRGIGSGARSRRGSVHRFPWLSRLSRLSASPPGMRTKQGFGMGNGGSMKEAGAKGAVAVPAEGLGNCRQAHLPPST
jgi:hypothetical protein